MISSSIDATSISGTNLPDRKNSRAIDSIDKCPVPLGSPWQASPDVWISIFLKIKNFQKPPPDQHMAQLDCIEEFRKKLFWREVLNGYKKYPDLIVEYILIYVAINLNYIKLVVLLFHLHLQEHQKN